MGICHEFGPTIQPGCDHPMIANRPDACTCVECGVVCHGKFVGCTTVWARGPQRVHWRRPRDAADVGGAASVPVPVQGDALPGRAPDGMAAEHAGLEGLASAVRSLVAEFVRLREDIDEQRAMIARLTESLWSDLPGTISAALARSHHTELNEAQQSGLLRRLATMAQPAPAVDINALARKVADELRPAIIAEIAATSAAHRASPDEGAPVPGTGVLGGRSPWQDRTA